jgi:hypothetical protein
MVTRPGAIAMGAPCGFFGRRRRSRLLIRSGRRCSIVTRSGAIAITPGVALHFCLDRVSCVSPAASGIRIAS